MEELNNGRMAIRISNLEKENEELKKRLKEAPVWYYSPK